MATIKFLLQQPWVKSPMGNTKKLNPKETRLYAFLIIDRDHMVKIKTEHVIYPSEWDFDIQGKKERLAGSPEFNGRLQDLKKDIQEKYQSLKDEHPDMSFQQLATVLKEFGKSKEKPMLDKNGNVMNVLNEYIASLEGAVSPLTIKKFTTLKNSLEKFGENNPTYSNMVFSMIDHNFIEAYRRYLRNQDPRGRQKTRPEDHQKGVLLSTQEKYIKTLKVFCKYAEERGYNKYVTYHSFATTSKADQKRKKSDYEIVALTLSELRTFYTFDLSNEPYLEKVRDLFCFGAFTGQRWGDFSNFNKKDLNGDVWSFVADKTKQEMEIDLTGFATPALDILKNYKYELPRISQQKFNHYLKIAAKKAGIKEETKIIRYVGTEQIVIIRTKAEFLSSHSARRTCVSILLNDYNMSIIHVMGITGHTDVKTLQKYIKKDRSARRQAVVQTKSIMLIVKKNEAV
jgi:integrase